MKFIVIEGPNGVGKTTLCSTLSRSLTEQGVDSIVVREPSGTPFGEIIRSGEASLTGRALALAVAADRHHQQETLVQPLVESGKVVISDRYVPSSLVLQQLDGLSLEEVWQYNRHLPSADHIFYLDEAPSVIQRRVDSRGKNRSRLEIEGSAEREVKLYREAYTFLSDLLWTQEYISCQQKSPEEICNRVLRSLAL